MEKYTVKERVKIIRTYYEKSRFLMVTLRGKKSKSTDDDRETLYTCNNYC